MGGAQSKSNITNTVNQVIDNKIDLTAIKETTYKNIINTMTENSSSCAANAKSSQDQSTTIGSISNLKGARIGGGTQKQSSKLSLSCVDVTTIQNNMANDIANAFSTQLESKFDTEAMAKLEGNAKAQAQNGVASFGLTNSEANVNNTYNLNISNNISKTMKDIINNEVQRNFNVKTLKDRLATLQQEQKSRLVIGSITDSENLDLGNAMQIQESELVMSAVSKDETINSTIDKIANQLNSIDVSGVTSKASGDLSGKAESEAKQTGMEAIAATLANFFGTFFKGYFGMIIAVVVVIMIIIVVFFMTGGQDTLQQGLSKIGGGKKNIEYAHLVNVFKKLNN